MTTTKTRRPEVTKEKQAWTQDDLRLVYEIHTLSHLLYGEIAATRPWVTPITPFVPFQCPAVTPPSTAEAIPPWMAPKTW